MIVSRRFHHYKEWEDWESGMYSTKSIINDENVSNAILLLQSHDALLEAMLSVIDKWPISTDVNLSNIAINRRAWLGQAACCLEYGCSDSETKAGWRQLSEDEMYAANCIADKVISQWEVDNYSTQLELFK